MKHDNMIIMISQCVKCLITANGSVRLIGYRTCDSPADKIQICVVLNVLLGLKQEHYCTISQKNSQSFKSYIHANFTE